MNDASILQESILSSSSPPQSIKKRKLDPFTSNDDAPALAPSPSSPLKMYSAARIQTYGCGYLNTVSASLRVAQETSRFDDLFAWSYGDDLSAVLAILEATEPDTRLPPSPLSYSPTQSTKPLSKYLLQRAMSLYCRMMARAGSSHSWFRIDDLYRRYYRKNKYNSNGESHNEILADLKLLKNKGLIRTFSSEEEAAAICGCSRGILKHGEKERVIRSLGGKISAKTPPFVNQVFKVLKSQSRLSFTGQSSAMPVISRVNEEIEASFKKEIGSNFKDEKYETPDVFAFALRFYPLQSVRRILRIVDLVGNGPQAPRDGGGPYLSTRNDWSTPIFPEDVITSSAVTNLKASCSRGRWRTENIPGLAAHLGMRVVSNCGSLYENDGSSKSQENAASDPLFPLSSNARDYFLALESSIELRWLFNFAQETVERNQARQRARENPKKTSKAGRKSSSSNSNSNFDELVNDLHCEISSTDSMDIASEGTAGVNARSGIIASLLLKDTPHATIQQLSQQVEGDLRHIDSNNKSHLEVNGVGNGNVMSEAIQLGIVVVAARCLEYLLGQPNEDKMDYLRRHPERRHLMVESVLSYLIFDGVAILEKFCLYDVAVQHLDIICGTGEKKEFVRALLSRRTLGKASERLLIDQSHVERASSDNGDLLSEGESKVSKKAKALLSVNENAAIHLSFNFVWLLLKKIPSPDNASMLLTIAEKNHEVKTLGLHIPRQGMAEGKKTEASNKKLAMFTPTFDYSIANTLRQGEAGRSAFVGWDDEDDDDGNPGPVRRYNGGMSVESLALEEYRLGHLPEEGDISLRGGGWVGWHNEGAHLHALFNIFCHEEIVKSRLPLAFLTPFQSGPIDLHTSEFYSRRKEIIEAHFAMIADLSASGLVDYIFNHEENLSGRHRKNLRTLAAVAVGIGGKGLVGIFRAFCYDYRHYSSGLPDLMMIRCRYLDGEGEGEGEGDGEGKIIMTIDELGDFIGEEFSKEFRAGKAAKNAISAVEEVLSGGLDKRWEKRTRGFVGPPAAFAEDVDEGTAEELLKDNVNVTTVAAATMDLATHSRAPSPPPSTLNPLSLFFKGSKRVDIQTIFVEVKSANDTLDSRQIDWINIMSNCGVEARVCKFRGRKAAKKTENATLNTLLENKKVAKKQVNKSQVEKKTAKKSGKKKKMSTQKNKKKVVRTSWTCEMCTVINSGRRILCEVCGHCRIESNNSGNDSSDDFV